MFVAHCGQVRGVQVVENVVVECNQNAGASCGLKIVFGSFTPGRQFVRHVVNASKFGIHERMCHWGPIILLQNMKML